MPHTGRTNQTAQKKCQWQNQDRIAAEGDHQRRYAFSKTFECSTGSDGYGRYDKSETDDHETLEEALQIQEGEDQVTLFTCTPYGVNSHRLLVRGTRVPYNGEEEVESTPVDSMLRAIQNYYMLYLILGLAVTLLVILIMKFLFDRKNKKRSGKTDDMSKEG